MRLRRSWIVVTAACVVVAGGLAVGALLRDKGPEPSAEPPTGPPRGDVVVLSQTDLAEARTAAETALAAYLKGDVAGVWQGLSARALGHGLGETVNSDLLKSVYRRLKKEHGDDWPPPLPVLKAVPKTTILNLAGLLVVFLSKEAKAEMRAGTWPRWHGGVAVFEYTFLASPEILVMTKEDGEWMCFMGAMPSGPIDDGEGQALWLQLVQGFRDGELEHLSMPVWDSGE